MVEHKDSLQEQGQYHGKLYTVQFNTFTLVLRQHHGYLEDMSFEKNSEKLPEDHYRPSNQRNTKTANDSSFVPLVNSCWRTIDHMQT